MAINPDGKLEVPLDLSIVIPLYNEEEVLPAILARLRDNVKSWEYGTEVVFVDDGSTDRTGELLEEACSESTPFRAVLLSRNFGHQLAVTAGLQHTRGEAVAVLDGDLQDPPEVLPVFLDRLNQGYDVVYAIRRMRKEGMFKKLAYLFFYRLLRNLSYIEIPLDSGDFCVLSRRAVDHLNAIPFVLAQTTTSGNVAVLQNRSTRRSWRWKSKDAQRCRLLRVAAF